MARGRSSGTVQTNLAFGCVPVTEGPNTRAMLNDLCQVLGEGLGVWVRPHRAPSPAALASAYHAGRVQLLWSSPTLLAMEPKMHDAVPVVQTVRAGGATYRGVLFARRGRWTLSELEHARLGWVDRTSASGHLFMRMALAERGHPGVFAQEHFLGTHGAVVAAVQNGIVDVGATFAVFDGADPEKALLRAGFGTTPAQLKGMDVLLHSAPIPNDVFVAAPGLIGGAKGDLKDVLMRLPRVPQARAAMQGILGAEAFRPCDPAMLSSLRSQLRQARLMPPEAQQRSG